MDKQQRKRIKRRFGWYTVRIFIFLNGFLPLKLSYFLGKVFGTIAYLVVLRHRRIALDSLSIAFPEMSLKEKKTIARQFFIFMSQGSFELLYYLENSHRLDNIRIEGREYLEQALEKKKGAIILTAHLGNFPLMSLKLVKAGFPVNILTRPLRDEKAGSYFQDLRIKAGIKTIFSYPRKECVSNILKALKSNEIVIIQMDQNFGTGGVWVNFFGKLAATPTGPIVLSARTGADIVPAYIHREGVGKHCVRIFPQEELIYREDKNETILVNAIKFTRIIENWVKKETYQWAWIHRRWKSRPSEEIMNIKFKVER